MGGIRALFLATAVAAASSTAASAADLLPPPPPLESGPAAMAAPDFSGWYLRGDVGVGASASSKIRSTYAEGFSAPGYAIHQSEIGDVAFAGVGLGYKVNNWLRFDATGEYRTGASYHHVNSYTDFNQPGCGPTGTCYDVYRATVGGGVFLANAYLDLGTWSGITPFIGGGVGLAVNRTTGFYDMATGTTGFGLGRDVTKYNFAWAAMAGLSYAVTQNLHLELAYRYLDRGKGEAAITCVTNSCSGEVQSYKIASHDIRLGMRWLIADSAPYVAPPLVRKY